MIRHLIALPSREMYILSHLNLNRQGTILNLDFKALIVNHNVNCNNGEMDRTRSRS